MSKFFKLSIFIFLFSSFGINGFGSSYEIFEKSGKVGLKDDSGNVLIPATYDDLGWSNGTTTPSSELIGFKLNGLWGLISIDNKKTTNAEFTRLYPFSDRLFAASKKGKVSSLDYLGLINGSGKIAMPFRYSSISAVGISAIVTIRNGSKIKYGVVSQSGIEIIPLEYKDVEQIGSVLSVLDFNNRLAVFRLDGTPLSTFIYTAVKELSSQYAVVEKDNALGLYNSTSLIVDARYRDIQLIDQKIYLVPFNQWEVLNSKNESVRSYSYESMLPFGNQYIVQSNHKKWVVDLTGNALTDISAEDLNIHSSGFVTIKKEGVWGLLNQEFKTIITPKYDSIYLESGLVFCKDKYNQWSVFDFLGIKKSNKYYDEIGPKTEYLWPVKRKGHWGFIERSGNEAILPVYDHVGKFNSGNVVVGFHGEQGVITKTGKWIVFPIKAELTLLNEDLYLSITNQHKTLKSIDEGTIYFTENSVEIKDNYLLERLSDGRLWKIDFNGRIENNQPRAERFQEIRPPSEGLYGVKIDGLYGFIDHQNRLIIANRYEGVGDFNEGLAPFKLIGKWGYIDKKERIVVQPLYSQVSPFVSDVAIAKKDGLFYLLGKDGKAFNSTGYDNLYPATNGLFFFERKGLVGLTNKNGRILVNPSYQELNHLNNGFIITNKNGKYGLLTDDGIDVIPAIYDELVYDSTKVEYLAMKKSKMVKATLQ